MPYIHTVWYRCFCCCEYFGFHFATPFTILLKPVSYDAQMTDNDGNEKTIKIDEISDIKNFISKGKKPPTCLRFCGIKFFCTGGTPRLEADGKRYLIQGRGCGGYQLIASVTTKYVYVAVCSPGKGHTASRMNDIIQGHTAALQAWHK